MSGKFDQESLKKFEQSLPKGVRYKVAEKMNISRSEITKALKGKLKFEKSLLIFEELILEVEEFKKAHGTRIVNIEQYLQKL